MSNDNSKTFLDYTGVETLVSNIKNNFYNKSEVYNKSEIDNIYEDKIVKISYNELYNLKENANLTPGIFYRITDYECITISSNTQSANHPFDIIVHALDEKTLSENAHAIQREGDEYFADSHLNAWKLKYNIDNDTSRFNWAKTEIKEQPAKWYCDWGVLEERYDTGTSANYELRTIDGSQWYLYRPTQPSDYLENYLMSNPLFRYEGVMVINIIDANSELYFVTDTNPHTEGASDIRVIHKETGKQIDSWTVEDDYGNEAGTYYGTIFTPNDMDSINMICYGESIQINEKTYYKWIPSNDYDMETINNWVTNDGPFKVGTEGRKIYYDDSIDNLYYALPRILHKFTDIVLYATDGNHIYDYDDVMTNIDTISYSSYVAPKEGSKGVIYEMIDEYNNRCPYDFKNIQFKHTDGNWYYTFNYSNTDISKNYNNNIYCKNNLIKNDYKESSLPNIILNFTDPNINCCGNQIINYKTCFLKSKTISKNIFNNFTQYDTTLNIISNQNIRYNNINGGGNIEIINNNGAILSNTFELPSSVFNIQLYPTGAFVRNTFNLKGSWGGFTFNNGSLKNCYIEDTDPGANTTINPTLELISNCVMVFCKIKLSSKLKIEYANTTSSALPLTNLNINAAGWSDEIITIPSAFPVNSNYELKVAKNSNGEIKMWCDADLIK